MKRKMFFRNWGERGNPFLRTIDYFIGIPLIFFLGNLRPKSKIKPQNPRRIALLKTAGIGDTVLLSAISKDLRKAFPPAKQFFFCGANNYEIGGMFEEINEVVRLPITNPLSAIKKIMNSGTFDYWLDFGPWPRLNSLFSWAARATCKIGFRTSQQYRHYVYDFSIKHLLEVHELENYRNILRALQVNPESSPSLTIPLDTSRASLPHVHLRNPRVILHMFPGGSRASLKTWPQDYWRELVQFFTQKGWQVVCTGGEADWRQAQDFIEASERTMLNDQLLINLCGSVNLHQLALVLKNSDLAISIDTGIMHLAASLGVPVIALFGPTSPKHWRPFGKHVKTIYQDLDCSPCLRLGFESDCKNNICLNSLTPDIIIKAAAQVIS